MLKRKSFSENELTLKKEINTSPTLSSIVIAPVQTETAKLPDIYIENIPTEKLIINLVNSESETEFRK